MKHKTKVKLGTKPGITYRAECLCGWLGSTKTDYYDAQDEGSDHTISAAHAERKR